MNEGTLGNGRSIYFNRPDQTRACCGGLDGTGWAAKIEKGLHRRLMNGKLESGDDIVALRSFLRLTLDQFARAMGISVHTLQNWEQNRRRREGALWPSCGLRRDTHG